MFPNGGFGGKYCSDFFMRCGLGSGVGGVLYWWCFRWRCRKCRWLAVLRSGGAGSRRSGIGAVIHRSPAPPAPPTASTLVTPYAVDSSCHPICRGLPPSKPIQAVGVLRSPAPRNPDGSSYFLKAGRPADRQGSKRQIPVDQALTLNIKYRWTKRSPQFMTGVKLLVLHGPGG